MADRPRVIVVGLGPAGPELIDQATLASIRAVPRRFVRTRRHPAASVLATDPSFDDAYERATTLGRVYTTIVDELVAAATRHGEVLYAVPGSPLVAERTVEILRNDDRVEVEIHPALSFLDLAWYRLGIDPVARGVRIIDGQRFTVEAAGERGPLLVAQCDSPDVLFDIKLALDAGEPAALTADATITVLQRLGTPNERVVDVVWTELDRVVTPDHLTTLWIPELAVPVAREVARFAELVATLRRECPWDRQQTHASLMRHLVEETYEVLDAIEHVDPDEGTGYEHLEEELGDLLFQVVFHATLAAEAGQFTLADVACGIHDKLYSRHPHVFGDVEVQGADDVLRNWEQIKKEEKGRGSVFDGIPSQLPALLLALTVQKKAGALVEQGIDIGDEPGLDESGLDELLGAVREAPDPNALGALLFAVTDVARRAGVDPEMALRSFTSSYRDRVTAVEQQTD
jgi:tetrapyrrole methylase family protein/MazG family protein